MTNNLDDILKKEDDFFELYNLSLRCYGKRNPHYLIWCGYIDIPNEHGFCVNNFDPNTLSVHGGITYVAEGVDFMTIGFDCGHHTDLIPNIDIGYYGTYREIKYVKSELLNLAIQIHNIDKSYNDKMVDYILNINK